VYDSAASSTVREDARRLWSHRQLTLLVAKRQLGLRYQRSAIGIWWTLLSPSLETVVFWLVFSHVFRYSSSKAPYIVYLLSGLVMSFQLRNAMVAVASSTSANAAILGRVRVPAEVFAVAAAIDTLVSASVMVVPLLVVMLAVGPGLSWTCLLIPIPLVLMSLFALGVGMILAPFTVRFPDVLVLTQVTLLLVSYLAPVFYPVSILSKRLRDAEHLNPLFEFVRVFRSILYGGSAGNVRDYAAIAAATVAALIIGAYLTHRLRAFVQESL
jgi:ABC-type polysaccharide/polyol phosphate export permease